MAQETLLIVDDEPDICDLVSRYLSREGYQVLAANTGQQMHQQLKDNSVALVILDVRLPDADGFELAQQLNQQFDMGIVMLTQKSDLVDRVAGLESGADDYLTKPFELRELLARVKSVLRRYRRQEGAKVANSQVFRFNRWELDLAQHTLKNPANQDIELSPTEFDLLAVLVKNPNQVLSRDFLLQETRGRDAGPFDRTIDVRIGHLRKSLEDNPGKPALIKTVRTRGYLFSAEVE